MYYGLKGTYLRTWVLLLASLVFYAWGGIGHFLLLLISILLNYAVVNRMQAKPARAKVWLTAGLVYNILWLFAFKYAGFVAENLHLAGMQAIHVESFRIALPLGISFYTFQQMSMLLDVYREPPQKKISLFEAAFYVAYFPQLVAGPIVRFHDIIDQIRMRTETSGLFASGVKRFSLGLFKKVIFANSCAVICDELFALPTTELGAAAAWLGALCYALQIYFDFSGYSDMAIGLAAMFGFRFLENFNLPYIARSIRDFWHRWHISLSTWFRDYLYIPLGGSRKGKIRTYVNLLIVFAVTGFWHGASWNFLVWGLFHGLLLLAERGVWGRWLEKSPAILGHVYTLFFVLLAWVFFRADNLGHALHYLEAMFTPNESARPLAAYLDNYRLTILILAILSALGAFAPLPAWLNRLKWPETAKGLIEAGVVLIFVGMSIVWLNAGSYNPFIYFRF